MEIPHRLGRAAVAVAAVLAVLAGGALVADTVVASRIEAEISERIRPPTPGVPAPAVMIGGGPAARWSGGDTLPRVTIHAEGVPRPVVGPVTVEAEATDVRMPTDDRAAGDTAPITTGSVTVSVQITAAALGRALGMEAVVLSAADDPSLAGGPERRARITGTVSGPAGRDGPGAGGTGGPGAGERVSVFVDLVVDDDGARLVPDRPATGPSGIPEQDIGVALASTALTLPPDLLPLGAPVDSLTVRGGTITATGTPGPGRTALDDLVRPAH